MPLFNSCHGPLNSIWIITELIEDLVNLPKVSKYSLKTDILVAPSQIDSSEKKNEPVLEYGCEY